MVDQGVCVASTTSLKSLSLSLSPPLSVAFKGNLPFKGDSTQNYLLISSTHTVCTFFTCGVAKCIDMETVLSCSICCRRQVFRKRPLHLFTTTTTSQESPYVVPLPKIISLGHKSRGCCCFRANSNEWAATSYTNNACYYPFREWNMWSSSHYCLQCCRVRCQIKD